MKKPIKLPKFKSEVEEQAFWTKTDLSKIFDPSDFKPVAFPNLKPTSTSISIRLPQHLYVRLKEEANELNVPYQTLMKQFIAQGLEKRT